MITGSNIMQHEFIGLRVEVRSSSDPTIRGLAGTVLDESKNTVTIERLDGRSVMVSKAGATFAFTLPGTVIVDVKGDAIRVRPEDRIKRCRKGGRD